MNKNASNQAGASGPRKLGRGLSSLIEVRVPTQDSARQTNATAPPTSIPHDNLLVKSIPITSIIPNKFQPRRSFDEKTLSQLAESIRHSGMMQPVIVRPGAGPGGGDGFELIAGERRWRAAQLAGLDAVPALVRDLSDEESAEWAIIENVQREDLNPIERAWAFRNLTDRFGLSHGQIAERAGLERSSVTNFVRLTELEPQLQELISAGKLAFGHGRALLAIPAGEGRIALGIEAVREGWNVRRLERAAANIAEAKAPPAAPVPKTKNTSLEDLERRLGEFLGTQVSIDTDRGGTRGKIVIGFYGLDHFDGLMTRIGFARA